MRKQHRVVTAWAVTGAGALVALLGVFEDGGIDAGDIRSVGLVIVLAGVALNIARHVSKPFNASYELGRGDGYREGYDDGRKIGKPTVVKLNTRCCESCSRPAAASDSRHP